ncbi:MAG: polysaccharide deacetylase family protein [Prevotella sp.]|nr:polysaccharide deacetylase family protein [Prevotella sp.]
MIIEQPSPWLRWIFPRALWRRDVTQRTVYLTFDDGPIPEATPFVLDCLRQRGIKATFFMVGENAEKYPELVAAVKADGHSIGNHTYNHYAGIRHSTREYAANVLRAENVLQTKLFRPPHGWMRTRQYLWLVRNYRVVMWDLVTRDYSKRLNADDVYKNVVKYTRNGSIITFHDSLRSIGKLHTALPRSLDWLAANGYSFGLLTAEKRRRRF